MPSKYAFFFLLLSAFPVCSYETTRSFQANQTPSELQGIQIDEKTGRLIDLDLSFTDETGKRISLQKYFAGEKPVLLTIIYYKCPNLCQLHLNGLAQAISQMTLQEDGFEFIAVSMDPTETPVLAQAKKQTYLKHFQQEGVNWHFLTGSKENIKKLSSQVGFNFKWNEQQQQYAHLPVAYVLTPQGKISRYLYGVEMAPKTLKLSLVEASQGRVGGVIERILLFCFQFDPRKNRYTLYAYNVMRAGGAITVVLVLLLLLSGWKNSRKKESMK